MKKLCMPKTVKCKKSISILLILTLFLALLPGCSNSKAASAKVNEKLELAVKYLSENKYEEAILTYQDVIKIDSKNLTAYKGLSLTYQLDNKMDLAEKALADGLQAVPQTAQLKLAQAGLMLDQGKADQAEAIYKELTSADNSPLSVYKAYTYFLNKQGKQAEAIALLEQAVAKNSKEYNLNSLLADLYYRNGDQDKALAAINNSLIGQTEQARSYKLLAEMYQDKWTELIALGDQYIQQNQAQTGQLFKLSGLFGMGKYDDVIKQYGELAGELKDNARARLIAAQAYLKLNKQDQTAELLKPLKVTELHDAGMLAELANIYLETGDKDNARKLALQGIGSDESIIDNYIVMYKSYEGEDKETAQIWAVKYLLVSGLSYRDSSKELNNAGVVLNLAKEVSNNSGEKKLSSKEIVNKVLINTERTKQDYQESGGKSSGYLSGFAYLDTKTGNSYTFHMFTPSDLEQLDHYNKYSYRLNGYVPKEEDIWKNVIIKSSNGIIYDDITKLPEDNSEERRDTREKLLAQFGKVLYVNNYYFPIVSDDVPFEEHLQRTGVSPDTYLIWDGTE